MSDDVQTSATIASLRAEVERLTAELQGEREDLATARERAGVLEAEVRAWREAVNTLDMINEHPDHQHCISGEWDDGRKCDDCKLWSDAVRCRSETDRTHALDAAKFGGA